MLALFIPLLHMALAADFDVPIENGTSVYGYGYCVVHPKAIPTPLSGNYSCPPHFYCPNTRPPEVDPLSLPSMCLPTVECQITRLSANFCPPQGHYEPVPCPAGFYCPDFTQKIVCPQGFYCPVGTVQPRPCLQPFSICPEGAVKHKYYGGLLICLILDIALVVFYIVMNFRQKIHDRKRSRDEMRKASGKQIGTIADTTRTKKLAHFVTLEEEEFAESDSESSVPERRNGMLTAAYWKKRFKIMNYRIRQALGFQNLDDAPQEFAPPLNIVHMSLEYGEHPQALTTSVRTRSRASSVHSREVENRSRSNSGEIRQRRASIRSKKALQHKHFSLHMHELLGGFQRAQGGQSLALDFSFQDLALRLPSGKIILNGVTGNIVPGRLTVVLGPSGAGKTTFLNVLMGKLSRTGGHLMINGREVEMQRYKKLIGYVPQDDVMLYELTVRENIWYQARTRLPSKWTNKEVDMFVKCVLESLELMHVADNLITQISGGQRKRTSIAMELVTCPSALFCDEPTSGLDATAALKVAGLMKKIAQTVGITVVSVIHQPRFEIFEEFDDILLIAPGGFTVYIGPKEHVQSYMEAIGFYFPPRNNPADVLMDILAGKGQRIPEGYREEFDIHQLIETGEISFEDYDVFELVQIWKDIGLQNFQPPLSGSVPRVVSPEELGDAPADDPPLDSVVVQPESEQDDMSKLNVPDAPRRGAYFLRKLSATPSVATNVAFNIIPTLIGTSFYYPPCKDEKESVTNNHNLLENACKSRGLNLVYQTYLAHNRSIRQQFRAINSLIIEIGVALIAGTVVGMAVMMYEGALYRGLLVRPFSLISPAPIELVVPILCLIQSTVIVLAGAPAGVKIFSEERAIYWRERAAGLNPLSYYVGKNIAATYRFVISSLHFTSCFMFFACPNIHFWKMYLIHLASFYATYGMAFVCGMIVKRENASMVAVCAGVIIAVLCGDGPSITDMTKAGMGWLLDLSYFRWFAEAWYSEELLVFEGVFEIYDVSAALFGYTLNRFWFNVVMIVVIGFVFRVIGYFLMIFLHMSKQR